MLKEPKEKEENDKVPAPPVKVEPKVELEPDFDSITRSSRTLK